MSDDKMQELNQDLLEDDDNLLADIPMSLLYTSPISLTEEDLLIDETLLAEELSVEEEVPMEEELPVEEALPAEEELPEPDIFLEDDLLLSDDELLIEELIAEFHAEQQQTFNEPAPTRRKSSSKSKPAKEKADAPNRDRGLIILMAIASFLCIGIIGILIYWMDVFLK